MFTRATETDKGFGSESVGFYGDHVSSAVDTAESVREPRPAGPATVCLPEGPYATLYPQVCQYSRLLHVSFQSKKGDERHLQDYKFLEGHKITVLSDLP